MTVIKANFDIGIREAKVDGEVFAFTVGEDVHILV